MKNLSTNFFYCAFFIFFFAISACRKEEALFISQPTEFYEAQVANDWTYMLRELTKHTAGFTPPVAARAFGYAGLTLYETVMPGMPKFQSLTGQLTDMPAIAMPDMTQQYNWAIAANAAMAFVAKNYYPKMPAAKLSEVQNLEAAINEKWGKSSSANVVERSRAWGILVAKTIFEWSKTDNGHEGFDKNFPSNYVPEQGAGFWQPTLPEKQPALQPYWGNNRTFVPNCAANTQPSAPMLYSNLPASPFNIAALEVFSTTKNLTKEQELIARYWSDDPGVNGGTPPGHLMSVGTIALKQQNANLAKAAETYAKLGMAIADGFVSCWRCKYVHNYLRPITYIRAQLDPTWMPILTTPPFPEFTSGHSVASGASSRVLSDIFGYQFSFTDNTHEKRTDIDGKPRSFKSFDEMADEAAVSRLFGGIHYREACVVGLKQGSEVGAEISRLRFRK